MKERLPESPISPEEGRRKKIKGVQQFFDQMDIIFETYGSMVLPSPDGYASGLVTERSHWRYVREVLEEFLKNELAD